MIQQPRHLSGTLGIRTAALALVLGALGCAGGERNPAGAGDAQAQVVERDRANQALSGSRSTAIVAAARTVSPSVVTIHTLSQRRSRPRSLFESFFMPPSTRPALGMGSGFVIDGAGHILTNEHVVRGAEQIRVTLPDGRDFEGEVVGADPLTDVAVVRVEDTDLPAATMGTSGDLLIGEWVMAIGNPTGGMVSNPEPTVTAGVVSAVDRHIFPSRQDRAEDRGFYLGMIQTDAAINPGNSGGPLVNAVGEVVGMNSSIFSRSGGSEGLGFAIPIDRALRIADDLVRFGEVRRAWVGVDVQTIPTEDPFGRAEGVQISTVAPDSPADQAGLRAGPKVLEANGRKVLSTLDFEAALLDMRTGDDLELVMEGRGPDRVRLTAETLPSVLAERVEVLEGLELITVTDAIRAERDIRNQGGALVTGLSAALAQRVRFREGDVLLQINNTPIREAQDVTRILESLRPGSPVRIYFERNGSVGYQDLRWQG
jgi:serine protease Do